MHILLQGFGIGALGGIVPGSILSILLISVMQGGFRSGLRAFLWCVIAEVLTVVVLLSIIFSLPIPLIIFQGIGLVGGVVLFYFAWQVSQIRNFGLPSEEERETFSAGKIFLLAATNAPLYIFWTTVCAPLIKELAVHQGLFLSATLYMTSFEIGWSITTFLVMMIFVYARNKLTDPVLMRRTYLGVAILMAIIGVRMIHLSLSLLEVI